MAVAYAIHRFSGIVTPANAAYSAAELAHQLRSSGAQGLFTCVPLLETALEAAKEAAIPKDKIFIMGMPGFEQKAQFVTVEDLIKEGKDLPKVEPVKWVRGQGERQAAFLCYSSGTSGLPVRPRYSLQVSSC
jgi:acyl-CoA synthetase (AMP-forming)/AMP-acid ligase II